LTGAPALALVIELGVILVGTTERHEAKDVRRTRSQSRPGRGRIEPERTFALRRRECVDVYQRLDVAIARVREVSAALARSGLQVDILTSSPKLRHPVVAALGQRLPIDGAADADGVVGSTPAGRHSGWGQQQKPRPPLPSSGLLSAGATGLVFNRP
jgi:hypothetical protein